MMFGPGGGNPSVGTRLGVVGVAVGMTVGGYFVGRSLDRKTTFIKVLPD